MFGFFGCFCLMIRFLLLRCLPMAEVRFAEAPGRQGLLRREAHPGGDRTAGKVVWRWLRSTDDPLEEV